MHLKKVFAVAITVSVALIAVPVMAQVELIAPTRTTANIVPQDVLPDVVVNDIVIDFQGQYTGSQMLVELTSGSIYQNTEELLPGVPVAGNAPPNPAFFANFPAAQYDTFVAQNVGGASSEQVVGGAAGLTVGAGAVNLGGAPQAHFGTDGINQSWNASPGNSATTDLSGMLVARISLSSDAAGIFTYIGSANGVINEPIRIDIANGVIGIPEPSTFVLLGISVLGLIAFRRRRNG